MPGPSSSPMHRISSLILWVVFAVLAASAIYTAWIAVVNWQSIGV